MRIIPVSVLYCCVTNYHKPGGLRQHIHIHPVYIHQEPGPSLAGSSAQGLSRLPSGDDLDSVSPGDSGGCSVSKLIEVVEGINFFMIE